MTELLTLTGTLAIILIGIAILLQITSAEDVSRLIGRASAMLMLMLVALFILKSLWVGLVIPWLSAGFEVLKTLIEWVFVTMAGLIVLSLVGRVALRQTGRYLARRSNPQTGDVYAFNDSKDTNN